MHDGQQSVNLSLFYGVPSTLEIAKEQFNVIFNQESNRPWLNKGKYLVLKKENAGQYKNYWGVYVYATEPKGKFILKRRFK